MEIWGIPSPGQLTWTSWLDISVLFPFYHPLPPATAMPGAFLREEEKRKCGIRLTPRKGLGHLSLGFSVYKPIISFKI